jgi:hypothetical protein
MEKERSGQRRVARDASQTEEERAEGSLSITDLVQCGAAFGLWVGGELWPAERMSEFVEGIRLADYLDRTRARFIPKLVRFMTETFGAKFVFENEEQLKTELISQYIDEHLVGLSAFQQLTHDKRGAAFIRAHFIANKDLKGEGGVQPVKLRDLGKPAWVGLFETINRLLKNPPGEYKRSKKGNLWIFRSMSLASAQYLERNFNRLKHKARVIATGLAEAKEVATQRGISIEQRVGEILETLEELRNSDLEHALHGHFGDLFQALTYHTSEGERENVLVGFKVAHGAELVMFSPLVMCLAGEHVDLSGEKEGKDALPIVKALLEVFGRVNKGGGSDGILKGYLSVKHELRGDFSFGLANDPMSFVPFLWLISDVKFYYAPPTLT